MNPFISFCLYVAARVFVQFLKSQPNDQQTEASLQFLLRAMNVIKRKNPLTESFLVQLDVDLEGLGTKQQKYRLRAMARDQVSAKSVSQSVTNSFSPSPNSCQAVQPMPKNQSHPAPSHVQAN
jgi:hypothetical protein